jgi:hypothetical protein
LIVYSFTCDETDPTYPALLGRRAVYEVRNVPRLREDPRPSTWTHHSRRRAIHRTSRTDIGGRGRLTDTRHVLLQGEAATTRPRDCQLYTHETEDLMEGYGGLGWNPFEEWWTQHLQISQ